MLVKSINHAAQRLSATSPTSKVASNLETARTAFMSELNQFTQSASHEPGDSGVDRIHAANCLLAALSKEPVESNDGLVATRLEFGSHASAAAHIPQSLAHAMVNLATALGQKITYVGLPQNLTSSVDWLQVLPDAEINVTASGDFQSASTTAVTPQTGGRLENARANFMAEINRFRQGTTGTPGDWTAHREHVVKCLQAAVSNEPPSQEDGKKVDSETLNFGLHASALAHVPDSLIQATANLADAMGWKIDHVSLPAGLPACPAWLKWIPELARVSVPKGEGQSIDKSQLPGHVEFFESE